MSRSLPLTSWYADRTWSSTILDIKQSFRALYIEITWCYRTLVEYGTKCRVTSIYNSYSSRNLYVQKKQKYYYKTHWLNTGNNVSCKILGAQSRAITIYNHKVMKTPLLCAVKHFRICERRSLGLTSTTLRNLEQFVFRFWNRCTSLQLASCIKKYLSIFQYISNIRDYFNSRGGNYLLLPRSRYDLIAGINPVALLTLQKSFKVYFQTFLHGWRLNIPADISGKFI